MYENGQKVRNVQYVRKFMKVYENIQNKYSEEVS